MGFSGGGNGDTKARMRARSRARANSLSQAKNQGLEPRAKIKGRVKGKHQGKPSCSTNRNKGCYRHFVPQKTKLSVTVIAGWASQHEHTTSKVGQDRGEVMI